MDAAGSAAEAAALAGGAGASGEFFRPPVLSSCPHSCPTCLHYPLSLLLLTDSPDERSGVHGRRRQEQTISINNWKCSVAVGMLSITMEVSHGNFSEDGGNVWII